MSHLTEKPFPTVRAVGSADHGVVTLRGTVGSFRQKREARKAAERVHGVTYVENDLDVRIRTGHRRADAELRGDVVDDRVAVTY